MPNVTKEILKKYPAESMRPGDVFLTNDPWMCAGHLPDIAVVRNTSPCRMDSAGYFFSISLVTLGMVMLNTGILR